jgi:membrane protein DedA with SNARE-associated domain
MDAFFNAISAFVADHHAWAGLALGVATFVESLVLVGAFVPATAVLLLAGGLIASGALDPMTVLLWCASGAALGDAVSYAIGRRLGPAALRTRAFRKHRRVIARTRLFSRRYGVSAIFIGRFFGPLRAFVPVMAGMLGMKAVQFQAANLASAVIWVMALLAPGYMAAQGVSMIDANDPWLLAGLLAALVSAGLVIAWIALRKPEQRPTTVAAFAVGLRP